MYVKISALLAEVWQVVDVNDEWIAHKFTLLINMHTYQWLIWGLAGNWIALYNMKPMHIIGIAVTRPTVLLYLAAAIWCWPSVNVHSTEYKVHIPYLHILGLVMLSVLCKGAKDYC